MADFPSDDDPLEIPEQKDLSRGIIGPFAESHRIFRFRRLLRNRPIYQPLQPLQPRQLGDHIIAERDRLAILGKRLADSDKNALAHHFKPHILDRVWIVTGETIRPPDFGPELRAAGIEVPDLNLAEATTLDDVIVAERPLSRSTLMHELVHVIQWRILGVDMLSNRYLRELTTFGYESMPVEQMAVNLSRRYESGEMFEVDEELFALL
jgi:hypothetical protein